MVMDFARFFDLRACAMSSLPAIHYQAHLTAEPVRSDSLSSNPRHINNFIQAPRTMNLAGPPEVKLCDEDITMGKEWSWITGQIAGIQFRSMSSEGTPLHTIFLQSPARSVMDNVLHIMQADTLNQLAVEELDPHNFDTAFPVCG
ncbi:hypothetical protein B0H17DRAFT_1173499 [Mycena rosella]|uniref:Uncharacterized protein n=1 Tax=Mycena rosella TaxID=1033263 RepID=A0AAD7H1V5_MYCRO|nr:hypothetical protein B0H17DRAFT_1173499 [Mycena rosella]